MSTTPKTAKSVFLEAVENHQPDEWSAFLAEACGDDAELRARVDDLLRAHRESDSLLDQVDATVDFARSEVGAGVTIDRYTLREQIGEGGMGVVFVAEQKKPIRRKVALKVIKPGMDSKAVIARFEAERQALALMDHPNIAKVLDAGMTEKGRPYFVMELVSGVPITDYCDERKLSIPERLELFTQVCHAVQHAHQKAIIHRDLKPSNVLVTELDGKPIPKVIDFGVAKALHQNLTEHSIYTSFQSIVGTPLYMSPEQASLSAVDVDTRSDVYSLGVLLYELLTGTTPFSGEDLKQIAQDEVLRYIREQDPPRPSNRISTLGKTTALISQRRHTQPEQLGRIIRGDLDWIVMKALDKERGLRYETANGLAEDIRRHLADEPVSAGPPSARYRLQKFVRRNRAGVMTASTIVIALLLGVAGTTSGMIWAVTEKQQAEAAETKALDAADNSRRTLDLVLVLLAKSGTDPRTSREYTATDALMHLAERIKKGTELQPSTEAELLLGLGRAFFARGKRGTAISHYRRSYEIGKTIWPDSDERLSEARRQTAYLSESSDDLQAAVELDRESSNVVSLVKSLTLFGSLSLANDDLKTAEAALKEAVSKFPEEKLGEFQFTEIPHLVLADVHPKSERFSDLRLKGTKLAHRRFGDLDQEWFRVAINLDAAGFNDVADRAFDVGHSGGGSTDAGWFRFVGVHYRREGLYREADAAFRLGVKYARLMNHGYETAWNNINRGRLRRKANDLTAAEPFIRSAADHCKEINVAAPKANLEYAELLTQLGHGEAKPRYQFVLEHIERGEKPLSEIDRARALRCRLEINPSAELRSQVIDFVQDDSILAHYRSYVLVAALPKYDDLPFAPEHIKALLKTIVYTRGYDVGLEVEGREIFIDWMHQTNSLPEAIRVLNWVRWTKYDLQMDSQDPLRASIRRSLARAHLLANQFVAAKQRLEEAVDILKLNPFISSQDLAELNAQIAECDKLIEQAESKDQSSNE